MPTHAPHGLTALPFDAVAAGPIRTERLALRQLCFDTLGAHRVIAQLSPENEASAALCRRLGMRHEARFIEFQVFKGEWGNLDIFALLDSEYAAL